MKPPSFVLAIFSVLFCYCFNAKTYKIKEPNIYNIDQVYVKDSIKYTKREFIVNDTIVCVNLLASDQLNSIEILNKFLFNIYRDSFDLHSNRMIGSALIGKSCMSCHEARDEKVINFSDNQNFVPFIRNHLSSFKMDTLNSDEIFFLKEYFNFFKKY